MFAAKIVVVRRKLIFTGVIAYGTTLIHCLGPGKPGKVGQSFREPSSGLQCQSVISSNCRGCQVSESAHMPGKVTAVTGFAQSFGTLAQHRLVPDAQ